ncbi:MAG: hypothetical protein E7597_06105 [Ruminococcaceae bacterium]|nr:hypothetical protein [Oscillospiraceae bacterium]
MNRFHKINIIVLLVATVLIVMFMTFFPRSSGRSGTETRMLTEFPDFNWDAYFSGAYTATITEWFTDTVPHRDALLDFASSIRNLYGIDYIVKTEDGKEVHFESSGLQEGIKDEKPDGNVSDPLLEENVVDTSSNTNDLPPDIFIED